MVAVAGAAVVETVLGQTVDSDGRWIGRRFPGRVEILRLDRIGDKGAPALVSMNDRQ